MDEFSFPMVLDPIGDVLNEINTLPLLEKDVFGSLVHSSSSDGGNVIDHEKVGCILINDSLEDSKPRQRKIVRNRQEVWQFILSWSDELFHRQFRLVKEEVFKIVEKCKSAYPGKSQNGFENYRLSQIKGNNSTPQSGPIYYKLWN